MRDIEIKLIKNKGCVPLVNIYFKNKITAVAIIDSGSDTTVLDEQFAFSNRKELQLDFTERKITYSGLYSSEECVATYMTADIAFKETRDKTYETIFSVVDLSHASSMFNEVYGIRPNAILGSDFLSEYNVVLNYEKSTITMKQ